MNKTISPPPLMQPVMLCNSTNMHFRSLCCRPEMSFILGRNSSAPRHPILSYFCILHRAQNATSNNSSVINFYGLTQTSPVFGMARRWLASSCCLLLPTTFANRVAVLRRKRYK